MKIWTQKDVDSMKPDKYGIKQFPANTRFAEGCSFAKGCRFAERCSFAEWCSFAKGCVATSPFWSFVYEPPFQTKGKIYPPITTRKFWQERLKQWNVDLSGCYTQIQKEIQPKLKQILKFKRWSKCERRVLESWLDF